MVRKFVKNSLKKNMLFSLYFARIDLENNVVYLWNQQGLFLDKSIRRWRRAVAKFELRLVT